MANRISNDFTPAAPNQGDTANSESVREQDHRSLVLWAAAGAEHVLPCFEKNYPQDDRPRKAIEAGRAWARGEIKCGAAREAVHFAARAAARAAGHAAATAHMAGHARHAAAYATKAAAAAGCSLFAG
jgi:hypothetical protein